MDIGGQERGLLTLFLLEESVDIEDSENKGRRENVDCLVLCLENVEEEERSSALNTENHKSESIVV